MQNLPSDVQYDLYLKYITLNEKRYEVSYFYSVEYDDIIVKEVSEVDEENKKCGLSTQIQCVSVAIALMRLLSEVDEKL